MDIARNGREGFRLAGSLMPDLTLLDLSLPEMDGWELLRHMKENSKMKAIPRRGPNSSRAGCRPGIRGRLRPIQHQTGRDARLLKKMETLLKIETNSA